MSGSVRSRAGIFCASSRSFYYISYRAIFFSLFHRESNPSQKLQRLPHYHYAIEQLLVGEIGFEPTRHIALRPKRSPVPSYGLHSDRKRKFTLKINNFLYWFAEQLPVAIVGNAPTLLRSYEDRLFAC